MRHFLFALICVCAAGFGIPGPQGAASGGTFTGDLAGNTLTDGTNSYITADVPFYAPDGDATAPAYSFSASGQSDVGMFRKGTDSIGFSTGSLERMSISAAGTVSFSGIVTMGGSYLQGAARAVELTTAVASSPNVLSNNESWKVLTNEGATAENHHVLPAAAITNGRTYTFVVQDADGIQVNAGSGDTIRIAGTVSASGGFISSTTVGDYVILVAINATEWVALSPVMGWTFDT